jgi:hypothetical protein
VISCSRSVVVFANASAGTTGAAAFEQGLRRFTGQGVTAATRGGSRRLFTLRPSNSANSCAAAAGGGQTRTGGVAGPGDSRRGVRGTCGGQGEHRTVGTGEHSQDVGGGDNVSGGHRCRVAGGREVRAMVRGESGTVCMASWPTPTRARICSGPRSQPGCRTAGPPEGPPGPGTSGTRRSGSDEAVTHADRAVDDRCSRF